MELEDLALKHYRVERQGGKMIAIEDPGGNYKADSAERIERALNTRGRIRETDNIYFRLTGQGSSGKWHPMIRMR